MHTRIHDSMDSDTKQMLLSQPKDEIYFEKQFYTAIELGLKFRRANAGSQPIRKAAGSSFHAMESHLADYLYTYWYTLSDRARAFPEDLFSGRRLSEILRSAHEGSYQWENGWQVVRVSNKGRIVARRGNEERILTTSDFINLDKAGLIPRPGSAVKVVSRRDSVSAMPGFWVTFSPDWSKDNLAHYRIYWDLMPEGAPLLVREITRNIDPEVPFCLKLPSDPIGYNRIDTAVLYMTKRALDVIGKSLSRIHLALREYLVDIVPPLTLQLARGMSFAEEPQDHSESFGMNRCRLISAGLIEIERDSIAARKQCLHAVYRKFYEAGISPKRPYLNQPLHFDPRKRFFGIKEN